MNRRLVGVLAALAWLAFVPQHAAAHVLISDQAKQVGAVLHISPDDDPIAGQTSELFFDVQRPGGSSAAALSASAALTITAADGTVARLQAADGASGGEALHFSYQFPAQGVYHLRLDSRHLVFAYDLRVARGTYGAGATTEGTPGWAEYGLVGSAGSLLVLGIMGWNNRKQIAAYSSVR